MAEMTEDRIREIAREVFAEEAARQAEQVRAELDTALTRLRGRAQDPRHGGADSPVRRDATARAGQGSVESPAP